MTHNQINYWSNVWQYEINREKNRLTDFANQTNRKAVENDWTKFQEFKSYDKAVKGTSAFNNVASGIGNIMGAYGNMAKGAGSILKVLI